VAAAEALLIAPSARLARAMRALCLAGLLVAIPCALGGAASAAGGLAFGSAAPVDPVASSIQPTLAWDASGTVWVSSFAPGRKAFVRRSVDGGDSFRSVGETPLSPTGDVDVAVGDGGVLYAAAVIGSATVGAAVSTDGGANWQNDAFAVSGPLDDRLSLAVDRGATPSPADDTAFLVVHHDGAAYLFSSETGLGYADAAGTEAIATGRCGALVFDPVRRALYLPCAAGAQVAVIAGPVPLGQRSGLVFRTFIAPRSPGGGSVGTLLPSLAVDRAGTIYAVWVDAADHDVFYAASPNGGAGWIGPSRVNIGVARSSALPAAVAGAPGVLGVAWLGADSALGAPEMPAFATSPKTATDYRWYGFAALVARADTGSPVVTQRRVTAKPLHFGRIAAGDGSLGEYTGLGLNGHGGLVAALPDSTDQTHSGQIVAVRQLNGPNMLGSAIVEPQPKNPVADVFGDAAPAAADLTRVELSQDKPTLLRARITVAGAVAEAPPGTAWLVRFRVLSTGARGEPAYRVLYLGAAAGSPVAFFGGSSTCSGAACAYPVAARATGSVGGSTINVQVRLENGFGAGVPVNGDLLYGVTAVTLAGGADLDSTAPFDYKLAERIGRTTNKGRHVVGAGTVRGGGRFKVDVFQQKTGTLTYADSAAGVRFAVTKILRVRMITRRRAQISGTGDLGSVASTFTATIADGGTGRKRDTFSISLAGGYRRGGSLLSGGVTIR
jgi:hypothetical protein